MAQGYKNAIFQNKVGVYFPVIPETLWRKCATSIVERVNLLQRSGDVSYEKHPTEQITIIIEMWYNCLPARSWCIRTQTHIHTCR